MNHRTRVATVATMAFVFAGGGGSLVAQAADTPESAVTAVLEAFVAKDFEGVAALICEARRDEIAGQLDLAASFSSAGFDPQVILDGLTLSLADPQVTLVSQDEASAIVHLVTSLTMTMALDEETVRGLLVGILEASGQEVTDEVIAQYLPSLLESLNETTTQPVDAEVTVTNENGEWLMCDTFDEPEPSGSPQASASPTA